MAWNPEVPYDALPLLPPVGELETKRVLKKAIEAREVLARFDALASALPNPAVLINVIPLLEAQASSEIENIVTTTDELFEATAHQSGATPAAREALRYRSALRMGFDEIGKRPITERTTARLCSAIRGHEVSFRRGEVYIGDSVAGRRIYTPPATPQAIAGLLDNWATFVNEPSDLDPLVAMAVAHYQFEAIHPFDDGNGRTGRIVNVLMLCDAGLLHLPLLYLSRYIIESKDDYYRLLRGVTSADAWEDWILYMLEGVRVTAVRSIELVEQVQTVRGEIADAVRHALRSASSDVVELLMEQPYCRVRDVVERCGVTRQTAARWLRDLVDTGALVEVKAGRVAMFINRQLMDVLRP
jgi:Fic family protein